MAYINKNDFSIHNDIYIKYYTDDIDNYFECDDLIAVSISLLNKKGYTTKFCCSGHPYPIKYTKDNNIHYHYDNFYVYFKEEHKFSILPDGAYITYPKRGNGVIIRIDISANGEGGSFDLITKVYEINKRFYEWVEKLKPII